MASGRHIDQGVAAIRATNERTRTILCQVDAQWWEWWKADHPGPFGPVVEIDLSFLVVEVLDAATP